MSAFENPVEQAGAGHEGMEEEGAPFVIIKHPGSVDVLTALATSADIHLGVLVKRNAQEEREIAEQLGAAVFTDEPDMEPEDGPIASAIKYARDTLGGVQDVLFVETSVALNPSLLSEMRREMKAREGMCDADMQAAIKPDQEGAIVGVGIRLDRKEGLILSTANMIRKTITDLVIGGDEPGYGFYQPAHASTAA